MKDDLNQIHATLQLLNDEVSETILSTTYSRFFAACPSAESLWEKDDSVSRGKMFNSVILTIMDNLTRPEICENNLIKDIKDHDDYGVDKEMYGLFFRSLEKALSETLGEAFSQQMAQAWERQLAQIENLAHKHTSR